MRRLREQEFKPREKSVKFEFLAGKRDTKRALAFQFDATFDRERFLETCKISMVWMHLKDATISW